MYLINIYLPYYLIYTLEAIYFPWIELLRTVRHKIQLIQYYMKILCMYGFEYYKFASVFYHEAVNKLKKIFQNLLLQKLKKNFSRFLLKSIHRCKQSLKTQ